MADAPPLDLLAQFKMRVVTQPGDCFVLDRACLLAVIAELEDLHRFRDSYNAKVVKRTTNPPADLPGQIVFLTDEDLDPNST